MADDVTPQSGLSLSIQNDALAISALLDDANREREYLWKVIYAVIAALRQYVGDDAVRVPTNQLDTFIHQLGKAASAADRVSALTSKIQWQPIETAPKDGTTILAWDTIEHMLMFWHNGAWRDSDLDEDIVQPTHWMPLPEFPEAK